MTEFDDETKKKIDSALAAADQACTTCERGYDELDHLLLRLYKVANTAFTRQEAICLSFPTYRRGYGQGRREGLLLSRYGAERKRIYKLIEYKQSIGHIDLSDRINEVRALIDRAEKISERIDRQESWLLERFRYIDVVIQAGASVAAIFSKPG